MSSLNDFNEAEQKGDMSTKLYKEATKACSFANLAMTTFFEL